MYVIGLLMFKRRSEHCHRFLAPGAKSIFEWFGMAEETAGHIDGWNSFLTIRPNNPSNIKSGKCCRNTGEQGRVGDMTSRADTAAEAESSSSRIADVGIEAERTIDADSEVAFRLELLRFWIIFCIMEDSPASLLSE
jgi:hypothetical protein